MDKEKTLHRHPSERKGRDISRGQAHGIRKFLSKSWPEKVKSVKYRWLKSLPLVPLPTRLPFGAWWLAENDFCGVAVILGGFENKERAFIEGFLRPGLVVVDIGAHHGFYSLLASKKVGPTGRVLAFEPSPRERSRLLRHLRLNSCLNARVWDCALGQADGNADLFVVDGTETGCNSLRPPNASQPAKTVPVKVASLDDCLEREGIDHVDFIKMDVEGAEVEVLKGATRLLDRRPRPVLMCEVQDIRTAPWGYPAKEIVDFLSHREFQWFSISDDHGLSLIPSDHEAFNGNYIAIPKERISEVLGQDTEIMGPSGRIGCDQNVRTAC
jgi:FkbM family methyltransferase